MVQADQADARAGKTQLAQKPDRPGDKPAADGADQEAVDAIAGSDEATASGEDETVSENPFSNRLLAPSLDGGVAWINVAGPLDLKQLRGKFVVLDFWTYCCINCMHILPELKKVEHAYPNQVVVIGIHSAKFDGEKDTDNITEAVMRYEIEHPVVNDAEHKIWDKYGAQSWPSMGIIDPEGYLIWGRSGEVDFQMLDRVLKKAIPYYRKKGLLNETPLRFDLAAYQAPKTPLRFPGKVLADEPGKRLFIADSNHNRVVVAGLDGKLQFTIGSGTQGKADGDFAKATFDHPQGMALAGETLYIADTENHLLRKIDLKKKQVRTIAGTGKQGHGWPGMDEVEEGPFGARLPDRWVKPPLQAAISSPWDLAIHGQDLYIAMAGSHQIWKMPLDEREIGPYAGNGREDIIDGPLLPRRPYESGYSAFAQPSGLASDGKLLFVADSEGSSVRAVPFDAEQEVRTIVGTAGMFGGRLFTFGDVDGTGRKVRLQHCLGVVWHKGKLYVADTYNNKIKVIDVEKHGAKTLAGTLEAGSRDDPPQFDEPAGISAAAGKLYVADTNNHRIRVIDLADAARVSTLEIRGLKPPEPVRIESKPSFPGAAQVKLDAVKVKPADGALLLHVTLELPEGCKINALAPMQYLAESAAEQGVIDRAALGKLARVEKPGTSFDISLPLIAASGQDQLKLSLAYYYCQEGAEGLCKAASVVWTLPVEISDTGDSTAIALTHRTE